MRRFWSDLLASLYNIRDGIVKKKQELDEERAACEAEKEELRGQIAELQGNESIIIEPFAVTSNFEGGMQIGKFSYQTRGIENAFGMYLYDKSQLDFVEDHYELKEGKFYICCGGEYLAYKMDINNVYNVIPFKNSSTNYILQPPDYENTLDLNEITFINEDNLNIDDLFVVIPTTTEPAL